MRAPEPVERDSRGILDPWLLRQRVMLTRYPAPEELAGLVRPMWAVRWNLPDGAPHEQQVLTHPCANITVGHADARTGTGVEAMLTGVGTLPMTRLLAGSGWTVAAMTTPGGLGAFVREPATAYTDRAFPLGDCVRIDAAALTERIVDTADERSRVDALGAALAGVVARADPADVRRARQVAELAGVAERDRSLRTLEDLCATAGVQPRTLQRMFLRCAGVSPSWVLRRYRLLDAAEAARDGTPVSWVQLAADLGYADQAHLIRDFRAFLGTTPANYSASVGPR